MRTRRLFGLLFATSIIFTLNVGISFGRAPQGRIEGRVLDQVGAGVPDATVTVENEATGVKRTVTTNSDGNYSLTEVELGVYRVSVEAEGFETATRRGNKVELQQIAWVHFSLKPTAHPEQMAQVPAGAKAVRREIAIRWKSDAVSGQIQVTDGSAVTLSVGTGNALPPGQDQFTCPSHSPCRLQLLVEGNDLRSGRGSTVAMVRTKSNPFSFFLRDVDREYPIYIPAYDVVVTEGRDHRTYDEIVKGIRGRGWQSNLQRTAA